VPTEDGARAFRRSGGGCQRKNKDENRFRIQAS
jgi:hypothetical protein